MAELLKPQEVCLLERQYKARTELVASPAAIDVVGSVDDGSSVLLVQLHASWIEEEVLMHRGSGAPGYKLVHTAGAVPVVGQ